MCSGRIVKHLLQSPNFLLHGVSYRTSARNGKKASKKKQTGTRAQWPGLSPWVSRAAQSQVRSRAVAAPPGRFDRAVLPSHSGRAVPPMDIVLIEAMAKTRKPTGDMAAADAGDAWSTKRCKVPSLPVCCTLGVPQAQVTVI